MDEFDIVLHQISFHSIPLDTDAPLIPNFWESYAEFINPLQMITVKGFIFVVQTWRVYLGGHSHYSSHSEVFKCVSSGMGSSIILHNWDNNQDTLLSHFWAVLFSTKQFHNNKVE